MLKTKIKNVLLRLAAVVSAGLPACSLHAAEGKPPAKPNIILILADDLGYPAISAYGFEKWGVPGLKEPVPIKTPNFDKLAFGGIRFEYAYASPSCSPTRGQIMTGKYVHRLGLHDIVGRRGAVRELDLNKHATVAQGLRDAGYDTVMVGKWHLGGVYKNVDSEPQRELVDTKDEHVAKAGFNRQFHTVAAHLREYGDPVKTGDKRYYPDVLQDYILRYLDSRKGQEQPFFIYYGAPVPHIPHRPTPLNPDGKRGPQANGDNANLPYILEYLDMQIGEIVAKLEELGLRKNTLILFLGDNGGGPSGIRADGSSAGGAGKGNVGEGSRVPFIMNWPAFIPAGTVYDGVIDCTDVMPTLLELAGAPKPEGIDGVSLVSPMSGSPMRVREWVHCLSLGQYFFRSENYSLREDGKFYDVSPEKLRNASLMHKKTGILIPDDQLTEQQRAVKAMLEAARDKILPDRWPPPELRHHFQSQPNKENQTP